MFGRKLYHLKAKLRSASGLAIEERMEAAIQRSTDFHAGSEFSIEFISFEGKHHPIGITQKWTGPNFIETGQLFPAILIGRLVAMELSARERGGGSSTPDR